MENINIINRQNISLKDFLESHDYLVKKIKKDIWKIVRDDLEVFLKSETNIIFFEIDLGITDSIASKKFYQELLELNSKILPVSLGIDRNTTEQERLILMESRETENLDANEILSVFEALEIASLKVENLLTKFIKHK
jgi:hypothetical protein